jgi:Domain of unknown function (DUF6265)
MRIWQQAGVLLLLAAVGVGATPARPHQDSLDQLRWLAGCWELKRGNRTGLEMWMMPAGGLMMGASRTVANGQVTEWERLQLTSKDRQVVYTSLPSGQSETSFTSTQVSDSGFTVENLQHDFPQRIIYRRRGADSLVARIEGPGQQGTRGIDFPMKRVSCEAS